MNRRQPPHIEILNTGSELLLGQVVNTAASSLATLLLRAGWRVARQAAVPDGPLIREALAETLERADVALVTGGLGPTEDDLTREMAAELLGRPLREDSTVLETIRQRMQARGLEMRPSQRRQALVPEGARVLPNPHGTAPGLYIPPDGRNWRQTCHLFLLPGPPRELLPMAEAYVLPALREAFAALEGWAMRVFSVCGLGETAVEDLVGRRLAVEFGLEVGYCARPYEVDLRVIGPAVKLNEAEKFIHNALGPHVYTSDGRSLAEVVLEALGEQTLAVAESCTGGLLASRITDVPGASRNFLGGFVTYSNYEKTARLGVPAELIEKWGAVSAPVAAAMAEGARTATGASFALALTGIAGPSGGTVEKPAGTVFIGLASPDKPADAFREFFPLERTTFKEVAVRRALDLLRRQLATSPHSKPG